jgi:N6-adenosine-specific RNA methylase IME4
MAIENTFNGSSLKVHPVAELFPMFNEQELKNLAEDIKQNGQLQPIMVLADTLLDGRNRLAACKLVNIEPKFEQYKGNNVEAYIISSNLHRRHLNESQRAMIAVKFANMKQGERTDQPCLLESKVSQSQAAEMLGISRSILQDAKLIQNKSPELTKQIELGKITIGEVKSQIKKENRAKNIAEQRKQIENGIKNIDTEPYDVVVIDPPWNYTEEYDPDNFRGTIPYPGMTQDEIIKDISKINFNKDSIIFLWTTQRFLWDAKKLLDHFGYEYKVTLVWNKMKIGLGKMFRQQCEFCLVGIKGKPFFQNTTWRDIIEEPRREHSRKPELFYQMVEETTAGKRLDYYSRTERKNWSTYGNDTNKF